MRAKSFSVSLLQGVGRIVKLPSGNTKSHVGASCRSRSPNKTPLACSPASCSRLSRVGFKFEKPVKLFFLSSGDRLKKGLYGRFAVLRNGKLPLCKQTN